jgi:hypothetical protein
MTKTSLNYVSDDIISNDIAQGGDLMSKETTQTIETVVQAGILPPIVLCGVVLNVINMVVFSRQGLRDRVTKCLMVLTVTDTCYLISLFTYRAYAIASLFSKSMGEWWRVSIFVMVGVYNVFADCSVCITMLIAVERCVCVLLPLKVKALMSTRNAVLYALVVVVCVPANLLFCFKYRVVTYPDPLTNATRYAAALTTLSLRYPFITKMHDYVNVLVPFTSFTVVIASTILISVRMRRVLSWRQTSANVSSSTVTSQKERREAAVTRMLTTLCVLFTACLVPYVVSALLRLAVPDYNPEGRYSNTLLATTGLMHVFFSSNASINFVVYVTRSSKFKATLARMLGRPVTSNQADPGATHNQQESGEKSARETGSMPLSVISAQ